MNYLIANVRPISPMVGFRSHHIHVQKNTNLFDTSQIPLISWIESTIRLRNDYKISLLRHVNDHVIEAERMIESDSARHGGLDQ